MKIKETTKIILIFIFIILMVIFIPNLDNTYIKADKLYISEILVSNTYTHLDNHNEYSDYIEIHNSSKQKINLKGYYLSDSEFETNKWTFPNIYINPGEYLFVYASGKDTCDKETKICHTNFKLNRDGEVLTLSNSSNNIISKFTYEKLANDTAYGYSKGRYNILEKPTPGSKNSNALKRINIKEYDLYINEYMTHNTNAIYIEDNYYDWIEIYNNKDKDLSLNNLYLSDDEADLTKYKLPDRNIKSKEYLLVYFSKENKYSENHIYANFGIKDNEYIILSNGKKIIDKVKLTTLPDNVSYGIKDNKWYYFTTSTPGTNNNTIAHESLGGNNERP